MKNIFRFFIFVFPVFVFGQNWQPVHLNWKYNYKFNASSIITNTLWVDSSKVLNGDSVFYLNRVMVRCDTCHSGLGGISVCDSCYALKNQPQFLQRRAVKMANGIWNFRDTSNLVLQTLAQVNDTWLFDSVQNIHATVIDISLSSVLGNSDSVKTIWLSSNDTILLSKSYGLFSFMGNYSQHNMFSLVGIEEINLGEKVPGFSDFFNFQIGDMFEYGISKYDFSFSPTNYTTGKTRKFRIDAVISGSDSVKYHCIGFEAGWYHYMGSSFDTTTYFANNVSEWITEYRVQNLVTTYYPMQAYPMEYFPWTGSINSYDYLKLFQDSASVLTKSVGYFINNCDYDYYSECTPGSSLLYLHEDGTRLLEYKLGLGRTHLTSGCFEGGSEELLVAYRKGADTVGVFTPDSLLNGVKNNSLVSGIKIFPNPVNQLLTLQFAEQSIGIVSLFNLFGEEVYFEKVNGYSHTINTSNLPSGFYFLKITSSEKSITKKIIVAH